MVKPGFLHLGRNDPMSLCSFCCEWHRQHEAKNRCRGLQLCCQWWQLLPSLCACLPKCVPLSISRSLSFHILSERMVFFKTEKDTQVDQADISCKDEFAYPAHTARWRRRYAYIIKDLVLAWEPNYRASSKTSLRTFQERRCIAVKGPMHRVVKKQKPQKNCKIKSIFSLIRFRNDWILILF